MGLITGFLRLIFKGVIFLTVLSVAIIFIPGIPPHNVNFESFEIAPPLKLEGKLAPNSILNNVKVLKVDKELDFPESIALRGDELYLGHKSGKVLKVKDGKISLVAKLGFPCSRLDQDKCSLPLAFRFDPKSGKLVFTDIYGGLLQVNVDTGKVEKLIARHEYIEGAPVGFPEDLDITKDGIIYWSDATTTSTLETIWNGMFGHPSGRLLKYDPSKNKSTVLIKDIHFANGVQLSPNEDFVLVSDTIQCQIRRHYLKGPKKGQSDIFISGLPGYPDNIRSNNKGGFYVSLYGPRLPVPLEGLPLVRKLVARTFTLLDYLSRRLYTAFPTEFTKYLNVMVLSVSELPRDESENAFILELNEKGEILSSLQSTNSVMQSISQITVGEKYTYFVSPANTKIWYMNTKDLKQN
jgi:hypothetical protein